MQRKAEAADKTETFIFDDVNDAANAIVGAVLVGVLGRAMSGGDTTDRRFRVHLAEQIIRVSHQREESLRPEQLPRLAFVERVLRRVAVFCGSGAGTDPKLSHRSYEVGRGLAEHGIGLVYGAGGFGLMHDVSQGALDAGGEVIGVIPRSMVEREWGRTDLTELRIVGTMHERKAMMADYADAFLCLPGGLGTLEEIIEVWSWRHIGFNDDPVGFLNIDGFWTPLLDALDGLVDAGFVRRKVMDDLVVADNLDAALAGLASRADATLEDELRPGSS